MKGCQKGTDIREYVLQHVEGDVDDYFLDEMFDKAIVGVAEGKAGWFVIYNYGHCGGILEKNGDEEGIEWLYSTSPKNVLWEEE